ncbi:MAG: FliH/SctL family protein [Sulfuritalea sp.]|nr:FliH/SctL family protein [Sulfuritalea sp.]
MALTNFNNAVGGIGSNARMPARGTQTTGAGLACSPQEAAALREAARQEGYKTGFDSGRVDGLKAGRETAEADGRILAMQLARAISRFDEGVADLERATANEILALALEVSRRVIHQTIAARPQVVLEAVREALTHLPAQHGTIHLNAEDAALVRSQAGEQLGRAGHRIQEDPQLGRGDVVIETGGTQLDARLATRWQRVIGALDQHTPWLVADDMEHA